MAKSFARRLETRRHPRAQELGRLLVDSLWNGRKDLFDHRRSPDSTDFGLIINPS